MSRTFRNLVDNVRDMMNTGLGQEYPSAVWTMASEQAGKLEKKYNDNIDVLKKENKELETSLLISHQAMRLTNRDQYETEEKFIEKERELKKSLKTAHATIAEGAEKNRELKAKNFALKRKLEEIMGGIKAHKASISKKSKK